MNRLRDVQFIGFSAMFAASVVAAPQSASAAVVTFDDIVAGATS